MTEIAENHVVTIGSMNMDIVGRSDRGLRLADSNPGRIIHSPGGVGRNIAHNLALLGKKSACGSAPVFSFVSSLVSVVGDDLYGQTLLEAGRTIGLDVCHCVILAGATSSIYLALLDERGDMVGAINDMAIIERLGVEHLAPLLPFLQTARAVVVDCNLREDLLEWLLNKQNLPPIFVDAVSAHKIMKIRHLLPFIHTLKPNRLEAQTLSGMPIDTSADMEKVACWFHEQGLRQLVISDGCSGAWYSEKNGENGWQPACSADIVNVSGAGDAMMAGLVCGWLEGWDLSYAVRFAQQCAVLTLGCETTNNPRLSFDYILEKLAKNQVRY